MKQEESIKFCVLAAIKDCNGNISFDVLMRSCGLSFVELSSMLGLLLKEGQVCLYVPQRIERGCSYIPRSEELFKRFMDLLSIHIPHERSVAFYASKMCITTKYLTTVVRMTSGKTPAMWIGERVVEEIKFRLCHSQSSIKEIACELNFSNASFFGKYFKSRTNLSPSQYRVKCSGKCGDALL